MACYSSRGGSISGGSAAGGGDGFVSNAKATLFKKSGFSRYGKITYTSGGIHDIQILNLEADEQLSSIRIDTSASKGTIDEELYVGNVFISAKSGVVVGDGMRINNGVKVYNLRVAKVSGVYDATEGLLYYKIGLIRQDS